MSLFGKLKIGWGTLVFAIFILVIMAYPLWQLVDAYERVGDEREATDYFEVVGELAWSLRTSGPAVMTILRGDA